MSKNRRDVFLDNLRREIEAVPADHRLATARGTMAHVYAIQYDTGLKFILTGRDFAGRSFRKTARSYIGVSGNFQAVAGLTRAWLVREDGTRTLVYERAAAQ